MVSKMLRISIEVVEGTQYLLKTLMLMKMLRILIEIVEDIQYFVEYIGDIENVDDIN